MFLCGMTRRLSILTPAWQDEEARFSLAASKLEFDRHLAPYNLHKASAWHDLSCHISKHTIDTIGLPPHSPRHPRTHERPHLPAVRRPICHAAD